jgi:hypothetical protein
VNSTRSLDKLVVHLFVLLGLIVLPGRHPWACGGRRGGFGQVEHGLAGIDPDVHVGRQSDR